MVIRSTTLLLFYAILASSQEQDHKVIYTKQELPLVDKVRALSVYPGDKRRLLANDTAMEIRRLPVSLNKLRLADSLAFVSTAGDPGHDTLQEVATTLDDAMREQPGKLDSAYFDLARLVHYEHVQVSKATLDDPKFAGAMSQFEADDQHRREVNFTLADLNGKNWFWSSLIRFSPQEMLDCEALYQRFKKENLVILAISGEKPEQVKNFVKSQKITFSVLCDPEQKVARLFRIVGVSKSFVYDREGQLAAQAIDVRTRKQLSNMLEQAGLK